MKTSARPSAAPAATTTTIGIAERVRRAWLRLWLRHQLDAYTRSLHTIAAQRENDFLAERMLHREISAARSRLQSL
jgi:hypothetical protein